MRRILRCIGDRGHGSETSTRPGLVLEVMMQTNVGTIDRGIRIALALGLFSLLLFVDGPFRWLGLVGLVPLATGAIGFCPLYRLFGVRTCRVTQQA